MHFAVPGGPQDGKALGEAIAAHLGAVPGIEVVGPGEGAAHMVTSRVAEAPNGTARIEVGLVRAADTMVVGRRVVEVTLGAEGEPLSRRIADEVLRSLEEAGLR